MPNMQLLPLYYCARFVFVISTLNVIRHNGTNLVEAVVMKDIITVHLTIFGRELHV